MFTKRVIPCLDVHEGRVVKGVNFVDLRDAGDPVEVGAAMEEKALTSWSFLILRHPLMPEKRRLIWCAG